MINKSAICNLGLTFVDEYSFDDTHSSFVFKKDNTCIIVDNNICENDKEVVFDYSKYCEMQNKYMAEYEKLYRVNFTSENIYSQIYDWLNKTPADIEIKDNGGSFDNAHLDNTPLEKTFYVYSRFENDKCSTNFYRKTIVKNIQFGPCS